MRNITKSSLPPSTHAPVPPDTPAPHPPSPLAPLLKWWEGWKSFSSEMGNFQSRILLGFFYFFVVTPFGVAMRVFGDPLNLRRAGRSSNWKSRDDAADISLDEGRKQF